MLGRSRVHFLTMIQKNKSSEPGHVTSDKPAGVSRAQEGGKSVAKTSAKVVSISKQFGKKVFKHVKKKQSNILFHVPTIKRTHKNKEEKKKKKNYIYIYIYKTSNWSQEETKGAESTGKNVKERLKQTKPKDLQTQKLLHLVQPLRMVSTTSCLQLVCLLETFLKTKRQRKLKFKD